MLIFSLIMSNVPRIDARILGMHSLNKLERITRPIYFWDLLFETFSLLSSHTCPISEFDNFLPFIPRRIMTSQVKHYHNNGLINALERLDEDLDAGPTNFNKIEEGLFLGKLTSLLFRWNYLQL